VKAVLENAERANGPPAAPHDVGLDVTMKQLGSDTSSGVLKTIASIGDLSSSDPTIDRLVQGLLRELQAFAALDGGATPASSDKPVDIPLGGIGQVAQSDPPGEVGSTIIIRSPGEVFEISADNIAADVVAQLAASFGIVSLDELRAKWKGVRNGAQTAAVSLLSAPIHLFGYNAPRPIFDKNLNIITTVPLPDWPVATSPNDYIDHVFLSAELPGLIAPTSILLTIDGTERPKRIKDAKIIARSDYGLTLKVTQCDLDPPEDWRPQGGDTTILHLRTTLAVVPAKTLPLGEAPLLATIGKNATTVGLSAEYEFAAEVKEVELDDIYLGIRPGQLIIVEGERVDLPGVIAREFAQVKFVRHILRNLPGDTVHTRLFLDSELEHTYQRDTVTIYANVVRATHGETVRQVLGSGDASKVFQQFSLAKAPLTYLPAPTPSGIVSTLRVRVSNVLWHSQESLLDSSPTSRDYVVEPDESGGTQVRFGDGRLGARLPTGRENVRAEYRTGLGKAGNVKAGKINQLAGRPLGVKGVTNPLAASGGSDAEGVDQIRANAPLAVAALDRLVSVRDYADFARNYAGIDKAAARRLECQGQPTVYVTIAGVDDIPILADSELLLNLKLAFELLGDPVQLVDVEPRELLIVFLSAGVRLLPDYEWISVAPVIADSLYDSFSFARRELGQNVYLSDIQATIQSVEGVEYVDVEILGAVPEQDFRDALNPPTSSSTGTSSGSGSGTSPLSAIFDFLRQPPVIPKPVIHVQGIRTQSNPDGTMTVRHAQIAYLNRDVSDSLFLREITA
jgi:hypothetical protein